jgi:acyl-CoA thioester hydrolase
MDFLHSHRVSYAETAPGNHVYFSRYLEMIEECRGEFFRHMDNPLKKLAEEAAIQFPVRECNIKYHGSARHDDELTIGATLTGLARARITLAYQIQRGDELLVTATIEHACVGSKGRPCRIPTELSAALRELSSDE